MEGEQDSRKRKLAALKARREQGNRANAALVDQEEARFVRYFVVSVGAWCQRVSFVGRRKPLVSCAVAVSVFFIFSYESAWPRVMQAWCEVD